MNKLLLTSAICAFSAAPTTAQVSDTAPQVATTAVTGTEAATLLKTTPIRLAVLKEVNSSTHEAGDTFQLSVIEDMKIDGMTVIPAGTPATAEITWRTGKWAFGKSGKLEFAIRSIDLPNGPMPVSGEYRQDGEGNTVATGVGVVAIGRFAGFITGKRARVPAGRELMAQPFVDTPFVSSGKFADGFDGQRVLDDAVASTP